MKNKLSGQSALQIIPKITDRMGAYWDQPARKNIVINSDHAIMSAHSFNNLPEYSSSIPTGVYEGKMWKRQFKNGWDLYWFYNTPGKDDLCSTDFREILLVG